MKLDRLFFLMLLTSMITGSKIRTMWMTPFYLFSGVLLIYVFQKNIPPEWEKQLKNLNERVRWMKYTLGFASFGFLFNMMTVFALYLDSLFFARFIFGSCCLAMIISVIFFISSP